MEVRPLVGVISSRAADSRVASRGFPHVSRLLVPFTAHQISIKDPSNGQSTTTSVSLDFRDLRRQGHLLTLSVLPHVLQEALIYKSSIADSLKYFRHSLSRWMEPTDQETLSTFLACIFVVSAGEDQPLSELSRLIQSQHTLQHSTDSKPLAPSHFSAPKWTTPNTLKYYLLLHDQARDDDARSNDVYNQMCATYGADYCDILRIGGAGISEGLADLWLNEEESDLILERGLSRALRHVSASQHQKLEKKESGSSVATISPSYAFTQPSVPTTTPSNSNSCSTTASHQRLASSADREACGETVLKFLNSALIPHVERLMRTLHEQLADRRGIGKSFTSGMKKLFGGGGSSASLSSTPMTYPAESAEMKSRRLADLALQFGLFVFAQSQFRIVKNDFRTEQALLYQAAALEMCALSLKLSVSCQQLTAKQFPFHYLEEALNLMLQNSAGYPSVMRCALNSASIYAAFDLHRDAANALAKLSALDSDQYVGMAQLEAAEEFEAARMMRKAAFYRVLAGNRFLKAQMTSLATECYRISLTTFNDGGWECAEDHLLALVATETQDGPLAMSSASRLLRQTPWQNAARQQEFLDGYVSVVAKFGPKQTSEIRLPVPLIDQNATRVIRGERPLSDEFPTDGDVDWAELQRASYYAVAGPSSTFRPLQLVSTGTTNNTRVRETPPDERFRLVLTLTNPLIIPLALRNVRLGVSDVESSSGALLDDVEVLNEVKLEPEETKQVELSVRPSALVQNFRINSVLCDVVASDGQSVVAGRIDLVTRGRRLNNNSIEMKSVVYAADERLRGVVAGSHWPLLNVRIVRGNPNRCNVFSSQAVRLVLELENVGNERVEGFCVGTNEVDCCHVAFWTVAGEIVDVPGRIAQNNADVRVYRFEDRTLEVGQKMRVVLNVRAPDGVVDGRSVGLLLFYRGVGGAYREWRTVITMNTSHLMNFGARVVDANNGLVLLNLVNLMAASDVALARIDALRLRVVRQRLERNEWKSVPSRVSLIPVQARNENRVTFLETQMSVIKVVPATVESQLSMFISITSWGINLVQIDSEQTDNICVSVRGDVNGSDELWMGDVLDDAPRWTSPRPAVADVKGLPTSDIAGKEYVQMGLLWKASIVNNEGHVSTLIGELFIPCPFDSAGHLIPGLSPNVLNNGLASSDKTTGVCRPAFVVSLDPVPTKTHNFKHNRLCEIPLNIGVLNQDYLKKRAAEVTLRFIPPTREAVTSSQQVSPELRQQWWVNKQICRAKVEPMQKHIFQLLVRISQPSLFDLSGAQFALEGLFDGETEPLSIKVPSTMITVHSE